MTQDDILKLFSTTLEGYRVTVVDKDPTDKSPDTYEIVTNVAVLAKLDDNCISFQSYAVNCFLAKNIPRKSSLETCNDPKFKSLNFLRLSEEDILELDKYCDSYDLLAYPPSKGRKFFYHTEEEKRNQIIKVLDGKGGSVSVDGTGKVTKETYDPSKDTKDYGDDPEPFLEFTEEDSETLKNVSKGLIGKDLAKAMNKCLDEWETNHLIELAKWKARLEYKKEKAANV